MAPSELFKVTPIGDRIWSIAGSANDLMYLVQGSKKALLVDTGMGIGDLAGLIRSITSLPVEVVNTHGHPDHAGGNANFDRVWLHPADQPILRKMCTYAYRSNDVKAARGTGDPQIEQLVGALIPDKPYDICTLEQGQIFDLGDRAFEVIEMPGHTPGSIGLLNSKEQLLFSGDSIIATPAWLYLDHSLPLHSYLESLKHIQERTAEFTSIFPGHLPSPIEKNVLVDLISCAEKILHAPQWGEAITTFVGEGLTQSVRSAQIIYNPDNL